MLYYGLMDNGTITGFTELEWVAEIKGYKYTTDENIVMQKDGSGWVFESQYDDTLEPANEHIPSWGDVIRNEATEIKEQVDVLNDAMIAIMFGGGEDVP